MLAISIKNQQLFYEVSGFVYIIFIKK